VSGFVIRRPDSQNDYMWERSRQGAAIIRNQETSLSLPPAPEFGSDATQPPEVTEWIPLRWQLFEARNVNIDAAVTYAALLLWRPDRSNPIFSADVLTEDFLHEFFVWVASGLNVSYTSTGATVASNMLTDWFSPPGQRYRAPVRKCDARSGELRRLVHSVRWRREDPVIKLPPGSTSEMTFSRTIGLSVERSMTLANSLGLTLNGAAVGVPARLSSELQNQFALQLNVAAEESKSTKIVLQNSSDDHDQLYALWHKEHSITVTALDVGPFNFILADEAPGPHWQTRGNVEFVTESQTHMTSARVVRF
jgi:hypothetical protein